MAAISVQAEQDDWGERTFVLAAVVEDSTALLRASAKLEGNREFVLAAAAQPGRHGAAARVGGAAEADA